MRLAVAVVLVLAGSVRAEPQIEREAAARLLYGAAGAPDCASVGCLLDERYAGDAKALAIARDLYDAMGDLAGVGDDEVMDGGYRGKIHLVPQLPVGRYRGHLAWVAAAMHDIDSFFSAMFPDTPPAYRWRALAFRFVRSINKRTPSAYASDWTVIYNVEGSLLISEPSVRETLFHELFHLNDQQHGDWSSKTLSADYDAIVKKCGTAVRCLAPYAPGDTMVRGGTYYAFQPDNGATVHEYAAELAVRYYREEAQIRQHGKLTRPAFKCGPPQNARAWRALVDEFFGGRDLVPPCR